MYNTDVLVNPFPGLRAFEEEEDVLFFGREKQVDDLLRKLRTSRFLAIIGSSGSGKSSLVKSGLLPSLHSGLMSGVGSQWRIALFRPGSDPIGQLNEALTKNGVLRDDQNEEELETNIAINETILRRSNLGLIESYKQSGLDTKNNLLVLVDQFEELFRFSKYEKDAGEGKRDSIAFINLLLKATEQKEVPIYVVFTMRSDFLGDCTEFRGLPEAINEGQYLVPRMTREERREAITGPIAVGGGSITPALINRLLNDVGDNPDQLPILQHALMRTWDIWRKKGKPDTPIDVEDYEHIGTITEALSQHAEEAFSELATDKQRRVCETIFKELTDKGGLSSGIRRPRLVSELSAAAGVAPELVIKVIEVFRKPGRGFLMPAYPVPLNENSIIDISHESIMRVWKRLITWLEEEEESAQVYLHLCEAVDQYESGKGGLWRDPELQIAIKWKDEQHTNAAWASRYNNYYDKVILFLDHSRQQRDLEIKHKEGLQRQRLLMTRRVSLVLSIAALIAFMMAIFSFQQKTEADTAKSEALMDKKRAEDQKKIADSTKNVAVYLKDQADVATDSAKKSALYALEQQNKAIKQEEIAKLESRNASIAKEYALKARDSAKRSEEAAKESERRAVIARENEEKSKMQALTEKENAVRLQQLAESKNNAHKAILSMNEKEYQQAFKYAVDAYANNINNKGNFQDNDIYNALYLTWVNSISNRNNNAFHNGPVRSLTGLANTNLLFSGDETGMLIVSQHSNGSTKVKSSVNLGSEIRCLAIAPAGDHLLAVLPQQAVVLTVGNDGALKELKRVPINGKGRNGAFVGNSEVIVQSTEGVMKFDVKNTAATGDFKKVENCVALAVNVSGKIFIAGTRTISEYGGWEQVPSKPTHTYAVPSSVTSMSVDGAGKYIAAGTYDGGVWLKNLVSDTRASYATLHRSSVNAVKLGRVGDGRLQLATASSDKTVKITEVTAEGLNVDDVITLADHSKWVYSLFYTPDGKYIFSGSEDLSIIGWPTTMEGIYNSLMDKK